jgi:hypothetical protein
MAVPDEFSKQGRYAQHKQVKDKHMARGITIKVPTSKLLAQLESKLVEMENERDSYATRKAAYDKTMTDWEQAVLTKAKKSLSSALDADVSVNHYGTPNIKVLFYFDPADLPARPKYQSISDPDSSYKWKEDYEELSQAIRLLKMTDDEVVSTATYRSVTRFL